MSAQSNIDAEYVCEMASHCPYRFMAVNGIKYLSVAPVLLVYALPLSLLILDVHEGMKRLKKWRNSEKNALRKILHQLTNAPHMRNSQGEQERRIEVGTRCWEM